MYTNIHMRGTSRSVITLAAVLLLTLTAATVMCTVNGSDGSSADVDQNQDSDTITCGNTGQCTW